MNKYAPIILFAYKRLDTFQLCIESLLLNNGASESDLFIFIDGPKTQLDFDDVSNVYKFACSVSGFKSMSIFRSAINQGLAQSIIKGVTKVLSTYKFCIVLEDDIITSPFFLQFMNESLHYYDNHLAVMSISGYRFPLNCTHSSPFFLRMPMCWGWATWSSKWTKFSRKPHYFNNMPKDTLKHANFDSLFSFTKQYHLNLNGKINTWFIYWYLTHLYHSSLSLYPARSLCSNIGFNEYGTNSFSTSDYDVDLPANMPNLSLQNIPIHEDYSDFLKHKEFFNKIQYRKLCRKLLNL